MELLFCLKELDEESPVASVRPIAEDGVRKTLELEDESATFSMVNIGPGADFFVILSTILLVKSHYQYEKHRLVDSHTIEICDFSSMIINHEGELPKRPHNYYIQTYQLNDGRIIILGIKSSGEVNLIKAFEHNPYGLWEI